MGNVILGVWTSQESMEWCNNLKYFQHSMYFHHSELDHHGPTDGRTDGRMDKASYRDAWMHLKRKFGENITFDSTKSWNIISKTQFNTIETITTRVGRRTLMESDRLPTAGTGFIHHDNKICQVSWPYDQFYSWPPAPLFCRLKDGSGNNVNFKVFWLQNWATSRLKFDPKLMRL